MAESRRGYGNAHHISLPPNLHPVVRPLVSLDRSAPATGLQTCRGLHGCLNHPLGGHVQRACSVEGLDGPPTVLAHQLPRVAGSMPELEPSQEKLTRQARTGPHGQHIAYINRQGGLRSRCMSQLARHHLLWSQKHLRSIHAIHILATGQPASCHERRSPETNTVQGQGGWGAGPARGTLLAHSDLVLGTDAPRDNPSLADSTEEGSTDSEMGQLMAPVSRSLETLSLRDVEVKTAPESPYCRPCRM